MMCPLRTNARRQESSPKQTADLSILLDTSYAQQAYTNSQISFSLSKRVSPAGYQQAPQSRSSKGLCPLVQQPSCNKLANSSPCSCLALLQQGYTGKLFIRLSTSEQQQHLIISVEFLHSFAFGDCCKRELQNLESSLQKRYSRDGDTIPHKTSGGLHDGTSYFAVLGVHRLTAFYFMLQADPDFYRAEIRAGVAHWRLGNVEAAAQKFDQVCSISGAPQEAFDRKRELESFVLLKSQVGGRQLPINLQAVWGHGIILVQLIVLSRCLPSKDTYDFQPGTAG